MSCDNCSSDKILSIAAKCNDLCYIEYQNFSQYDYVPTDIGLGGGDYISFDICLNCGKVQGNFPLTPHSLDKEEDA